MDKFSIKNSALFVAGWFFVGLGVIGIVVPLMPTTPFLLVALICFSRSSERFHSWLFNHPILGKPLRDWEETRRIPPYAIVLMVVMISISLCTLVYKYY
ncbi:YbaN family protein [Phocoenobacter skyensis]|uniref:Inner membrane protein n=1 Tax=Phocoenobacter skyensis TaxID=97481 RepID=A0A1H7ZTF9_9PAST|nr:YbaN family protein [Pasteurella skyensis]MDP8080350.1 YbaN family protein [Pasteurella skyensis]MDP8086340.1 YbaN family protein [Pasteurella skyensis]MDP8161584.1 YbaN family protein [Pasteurella skyensis]MDP8170711.1 YbaN family protein [Pasteurella skyensis]MDP8173418.1 YbaN family protein [Pasteurella skyensis]